MTLPRRTDNVAKVLPQPATEQRTFVFRNSKGASRKVRRLFRTDRSLVGRILDNPRLATIAQDDAKRHLILSYRSMTSRNTEWPGELRWCRPPPRRPLAKGPCSPLEIVEYAIQGRGQTAIRKTEHDTQAEDSDDFIFTRSAAMRLSLLPNPRRQSRVSPISLSRTQEGFTLILLANLHRRAENQLVCEPTRRRYQ